jgi:hypothetical protein
MSTIKSSAENLTLNADGANNDIKFQSNGTEVASIDQAGLVTANAVGIGGTNDSGKKLHIEGNGTDVGITLKDTAGVQYEIKSDANNFTIRNSSASADRLTIDSNGKVGIGTASPTTQLDVTSSGNGEIAIISGTSGITSLYMGDSAQKDKGKIFYHNGSDYMAFNANGGEKLRIDATGAVTMPLQPAFLAQPSSAQNNIAEGTDVVIVLGSERFDQNSDFSSNVFTAPVTGKYFLSASVFAANVDNAPSYIEIYIRTSNRVYVSTIDPRGFDVDPAYWTFNHALLCDMDAGDTAQLEIHIHAGGTVQTDIQNYSYFSGYLAC